MGNCFSDPSSKGKGQKLGSAAPVPASVSNQAQRPVAQAGSTTNGGKSYEPPRTLGGGLSPGAGGEEDPRVRAMMAAEERANAVSVMYSSAGWILLLYHF
jgi:hypothetical protein